MKKTGLIALVLVLVASLVACRGGNTDETTNPTQTDAPTTNTTAPTTTSEPTTLPMIIDPTIDTNIPDPNTNNGTDDMGDMFNDSTQSNAAGDRSR